LDSETCASFGRFGNFGVIGRKPSTEQRESVEQVHVSPSGQKSRERLRTVNGGTNSGDRTPTNAGARVPGEEKGRNFREREGTYWEGRDFLKTAEGALRLFYNRAELETRQSERRGPSYTQ